MSAVEVTKKTIACMEKDVDFILVNFANPDMVGHTGNFEATSKAITAVDVCLGKILDENEEPVTTHTLAKVPFIIVDENVKLKSEGDLTNIAPTILDYMDIAKPKEMKDSESLLIK